nr:hypothetical protein [Candidatus Enterousia merdequi]
MKKFKFERNWSDLERADKAMLLLGVIVWLGFSVGLYLQSEKYSHLKQNIVKTEMLKHR